MVSTFTANINLEEPARGDDVGTWDTPVNANMTLLDKTIGGVVTIALNNAPVVLAAAQFQAKTIIFNSTLTGSVTITFPTTFFKSYEIINLCTGTSAFTVTLNTTNPGVNVIGVKPGDPSHVIYDGIQFKYVGLGMVGSYLDIAGSSVPNWVGACAIKPYLDCDGSVFSSATFPALATYLGGTTLPDFRGRNASYLNEGTGRITAAGAGVDGNTLFATGGANGTTLSTGQMPTHTTVNAAQAITVSLPGLGKLPYTSNGDATAVSLASPGGFVGVYSPGVTWLFTTSISGSNSITTTFTNGAQAVMPSPIPLIMSGLRLIRAA